ncbi:hypothetical protein Palpr_1428 [Paludibacter propionicigenes WB4]|uniref:Uncharacterized protein n=1 Tax=Paludibacter propionicigenes (strain DSM 17365 / JCM 13257 / WB4) TaxID=694427 RepID=E4T4D0_PALPW|nr:hypothetical protein [Paludibacter propionicigenes]ADQ79574.1 hypothetical protein Palpr_1428 [Paludibacter propionicigenes WB4]
MKNIFLNNHYFRKSMLMIIILIVGFITGYKYSKYKTLILIKKLESTKTGNQVNESDDELQKRVLVKGDTIAYEKLHIKHFEDKYSGETLLYDIIMANKYGYKEAYFRVYHSLISNYKYKQLYGKIDDKSLKLALQYLYKGVELDNLNSINALSDLYREGVYIKRDSVKSIYYDKKANRIMSE